MDPRYQKNSLLSRRRNEWDLETIKDKIVSIFKTAEIMEGWELTGAEWVKGKRSNKEELKRSLYKTLRITFDTSRNIEVSHDIQIPELVNNQYFYISGNMKLPMFQTYDSHIIYRGDSLKLRTNTISLFKSPKDDMNIKLFNRKLSIPLLIAASHTNEEIDKFFSSFENSEYINQLREAISNIKKDKTEKEIINAIGSKFSSNYREFQKKGKNVIFALKIAYEVDIFHKPLFETESVLFELVKSIVSEKRKDTDLKYKRLRFSEYVLSGLVKKVYDMIMTLSNSAKVNFQIPQGIIMDFCNKSEIVRYHSPVNPVNELANMMQSTLTGPGGFKKDNVPENLRDLDDSQLGLLCPADTPDRSGCGVTQNLVPVVETDEHGFFGEPSKEIVCSYPISLTPFLEHNDQVRLQMASSQSKQAILLKESEKPMIKSGLEDFFLDESTFINIAEEDGRVIHLDSELMFVVYDNKKIDCLEIRYRSINKNLVDVMKPKFKEGDRFKKGDILTESHFTKKGELSTGRNLLTGVAIWKGFNYEDGIVISKSVSDNMFTSFHGVDLSFNVDTSQVLMSLDDDSYSPLPKIGQIIRKGEPYAKIKTLDLESGFENISTEPVELVAPLDCKIIKIEIYPNHWNKQISEYNKFIRTSMDIQSQKFNIFRSKLEQEISKEEADKFITLHDLSRLNCIERQGKYAVKGTKFKGIQFKIHAIYEENIGIGDKVANRHGNKGVIALVEDDENMPVLPDGRKLDIIVNPLGIISRMNVGQLYELHLTEAFYNLKQKMKYLIDDKKEKESIKILKGFLKIIIKDKWAFDEIVNKYINAIEKEEDIKEYIDDMYIIQPPFNSISYKELDKAISYTGSKYKYPVYDSSRNIELENDIACGYIYFNKLIHRASDKLSARSIGPYSKKTLQPLGGKSRQGGHRFGEMEVWALLAHGANDFLNDLLTVQADSPGLKNKLLAEILDNPSLTEDVEEEDTTPQSIRLLESYFRQIGLELIKESDPKED